MWLLEKSKLQKFSVENELFSALERVYNQKYKVISYA